MLILCSWSYDTVAVHRNGYNHKWIEERISEAIDWPRVQSGILDVIQTIHTDAPVSHDLGVDQSFLQPAHLPNRLLWSDPKIWIRNLPPLPKFWEILWCWLLSVKLWSCWKQKKIMFHSWIDHWATNKKMQRWTNNRPPSSFEASVATVATDRPAASCSSQKCFLVRFWLVNTNVQSSGEK